MEYLRQHDRARLRLVLNEFSYAVKREGAVWLPYLNDIAAFVEGCGRPGDGFVWREGKFTWCGFTAVDGYTYYASSVGLWRYRDRGECATVDDWFFAFLRIHAHWRFLKSHQLL
jgi:hypothetical protein